MKQFDPTHHITVWERKAASDSFGFGVIFSNETLDDIGIADPVMAEAVAASHS